MIINDDDFINNLYNAILDIADSFISENQSCIDINIETLINSKYSPFTSKLLDNIKVAYDIYNNEYVYNSIEERIEIIFNKKNNFFKSNFKEECQKKLKIRIFICILKFEGLDKSQIHYFAEQMIKNLM